MKTGTTTTKAAPLFAANPRNPRKISEAQMERLKKSLQAFGDLGGIVFNRRSGQLVGGHQRIQAFRDDPLAKVEIEKRLERPDDAGTTAFGHVLCKGTRFAYREVDWDGPTESMALIAANKHGGEFVYSELAKIVQQLEADGKLPLELSGIEDSELDVFLNANWQPNANGEQPQAPASDGGQKVDKVYLTQGCRQAVEACKKLLGEDDDSRTIERVAKAFLETAK